MAWGTISLETDIAATLAEPGFTHHRTARTLVLYRRAIQFWGEFGVILTRDVTPENMVRYVGARALRAPAAARQDAVILMAVLSYLERTNRFPKDALTELRRLVPRKRPRAELSALFLERAEVDRLVAVAPRVVAVTQAQRAARIVAYAGLRRGEACRLRWDHIDLRAKAIDVVSGADGRTKTGRSRRIPLCRPLHEHLLRVKDEWSARGPYLVAGHRVARWQDLQTGMLELRARARVAQATYNVLRHTRASWWIQAGVPPAKVALWMGHSVEVCLRHYAGLLQGYDPDAERMPA